MIRVAGDRFKNLRLSRSLTIPELARSSGVDITTIWRIEKAGVQPVREKTLAKISKVLGMNLLELVKAVSTDDGSERPGS